MKSVNVAAKAALMLTIVFTFTLHVSARETSTSTSTSTATATANVPGPARSPEILATYSQAGAFLKATRALEPNLRAACNSLLESQLRLQKETDSWKMYSLYEMLAQRNLMTAELVRVPTVTQLSESLPRYTGFKITGELKNGAIVIADLGPQCGPDPLSPKKGAYFLKCGDYMIGSGLIRADRLKLARCANIRILALPDASTATSPTYP